MKPFITGFALVAVLAISAQAVVAAEAGTDFNRVGTTDLAKKSAATSAGYVVTMSGIT